jgi:GntR family transcriptional regulator
MRVRRELVRSILDGEFEERLPPIDELVPLLGVSRTTVRAAVQELERDGLVSRRRPFGTKINRHVGVGSLFFQRIVGFEWLLEQNGHVVEQLHALGSRLPAGVVKSLIGRDPAELCCVTRTFVADGRVVVAELDLAPWSDLVAGYEAHEVFGSRSGFLGRDLETAISGSVIRVVPMVHAGGDCSSLDIEEGTPFLRNVETHFDSAGEAVAWTVIDVDHRALPVQTFRVND